MSRERRAHKKLLIDFLREEEFDGGETEWERGIFTFLMSSLRGQLLFKKNPIHLNISH